MRSKAISLTGNKLRQSVPKKSISDLIASNQPPKIRGITNSINNGNNGVNITSNYLSDYNRKSPNSSIARYANSNNSLHVHAASSSLGKIRLHCEDNLRIIYGNPDGYAVFDGGEKGGYLIQSIHKIFWKLSEILTNNLDDIVKQIRLKVSQLTGKKSMQVVEDVDKTRFKIMFAKNTK